MTVVIGLTGSIATGKSTISEMFKQWEIPVVDADQIARKVVEPGEQAYKKIVKAFGEDVLKEDRTLNRKALGSIVFQNEERRTELNGIIHPEIRKEMLQQRDHYVNQGVDAVVMDIPLLFESELFDYVEKILVVYVNPSVQLERLMERDSSTEKEASERIKSQISIEEKRERADAIIDNGGTIEESKQQLKDILKTWEINIGSN